jgi:hypothetical protein
MAVEHERHLGTEPGERIPSPVGDAVLGETRYIDRPAGK